MELFVHTNEDPQPSLQNIDDETCVKDLAANSGMGEDARVWREGENDPLDPALLVKDAFADQANIHVGVHNAVEITVRYAGEEKQQVYAPSITIEELRAWAVGEAGFHLSEDQRGVHDLVVCETEDILVRSTHIGTLATAEAKLCLDLAPKERFQGDCDTRWMH